MKRVLCLYIPNLAIERLQRREGSATSGGRSGGSGKGAPEAVGPVAIAAPTSGGLRVVRANASAGRRGVRLGQTAAEAAALAPGLTVHHADPAGDRAALERLAVWADCLSPVVQIAGDDALLLDVTGCARLFGGEDALARKAIAGLAAEGYSSAAAIADTPGAAWALAHAGEWGCAHAARPGAMAEALARLPVWTLRLEAPVVERLRMVGVETVEALLHLPRSSVARRFGRAVCRRLDEALGDAPEVLTPFRPPVVLHARVNFTGATDSPALLYEAVERGTADLCAQLERRVAGVRRLRVTLHYSRDAADATGVAAACGENGAYGDVSGAGLGWGSTRRYHTLTLELSRPTRDAGRLLGLLRVRLEGLRLPAKVVGVTVWSPWVEGLDGAQLTWFDTGSTDDAELGDLWDRLAVRLGKNNVVQPRLVADHLPEGAYAYVPMAEVRTCQRPGRLVRQSPRRVTGAMQSSSASGGETAGNEAKPKPARHSEKWIMDGAPGNPHEAAWGRPVRLLHRPVEVAVMAVVPDGPPLRFGCRGAEHVVQRWAGPERVETGWWRGYPVRRDYFRVEDTAGERYWLFRACNDGRWFLHGMDD